MIADKKMKKNYNALRLSNLTHYVTVSKCVLFQNITATYCIPSTMLSTQGLIKFKMVMKGVLEWELNRRRT